MKIEWKKTAEFVALISVVSSLLFVAFEIRQSRQVALTESFYSSEETEANLRALLIGNALIWRKGCLGESLADEEDVVFRQLARQVNTHYFMSWSRALDGIVLRQGDRWTKTVALNMLHYPGFREAWRTMESSAPSTMMLDRNTSKWVREIENFYEEFAENPDMQAPEQFLCAI